MVEGQSASYRPFGGSRGDAQDHAGTEVPGEGASEEEASGFQGFGIAGIMRDYENDGPGWVRWGAGYDDVWAWWERPSKFTPEAFQILWDSFSERRKIDYVLSLIG